jgi:hypothetical protein
VRWRKPRGVDVLRSLLPLQNPRRDGTITGGQVLRRSLFLGYADRHQVEDVVGIEQANIMTSEIEGAPGYHRVVLDIDMHAELIPSSSPDHFHLVIDKVIEKDKYFELLNALANAGVIEEGYARASLVRGYSAIRVPWVRK